MDWKHQAERITGEAQVLFRALRHPQAPWSSRMIAACVVSYLISPIQLIPSYIPVIGLSDDALVVFIGLKWLQKVTPAAVLAECRQDVENRRSQQRNGRATGMQSIGLALLAIVWVACALTLSVLIAHRLRK